MRVYCTYCSKAKNTSSGLIPAYLRYTSARIRNTRTKAQHAQLPFYILSSEFGFIKDDALIPWYNHLLLAHEVGDLVNKVSRQLILEQATYVVYYEAINAGKDIIPYCDTIVNACKAAGVGLEILSMSS